MMTFMEAKKVLARFDDGPKVVIRWLMSGTVGPLEVFLRAEAALKGVSLSLELPAYGTFAQSLLDAPGSQREVILLMPWDLAPECDWRSGIGDTVDEVETLMVRAEETCAAITRRHNPKLFYLPAPILPIFRSTVDTYRLQTGLPMLAANAGAHFLDTSFFSFSTYLSSGCPIGGSSLVQSAKAMMAAILNKPGSFKVVVTDADNTLWSGVVGEDGPEGVTAEAHGNSYRHFIYQTFLNRLQVAGILLAVVSRNDLDLLERPFGLGRMPLSMEKFVAVRASYDLKSKQIQQLSDDLNLPISSFVYIDDNPVEIAEVSEALPGIICLKFPSTERDLHPFLLQLTNFFDRTYLTREDIKRTELYKTKLEFTWAPTESLQDFLRGLNMKFTISEASTENWIRAYQLIEKTNQFNINGIRHSETEFTNILASGGRLFTAHLDDRIGHHGEILACLVDCESVVRALAMSCRVFQRRVEHAFISWLSTHWTAGTLRFHVIPTERNEPALRFFGAAYFFERDEFVEFDAAALQAAHEKDMALFTLIEKGIK